MLGYELTKVASSLNLKSKTNQIHDTQILFRPQTQTDRDEFMDLSKSLRK